MTHLFYVRFSGDEQGTTLERKLKELIKAEYDDSVCTEKAVECIFNGLYRSVMIWQNFTRVASARTCTLKKPAYFGDGYRIFLERPNGGCNAGNSSLLYFRMVSSYFMEEHETLWEIADDRPLLELRHGLNAYNI